MGNFFFAAAIAFIIKSTNWARAEKYLIEIFKWVGINRNLEITSEWSKSSLYIARRLLFVFSILFLFAFAYLSYKFFLEFYGYFDGDDISRLIIGYAFGYLAAIEFIHLRTPRSRASKLPWWQLHAAGRALLLAVILGLGILSPFVGMFGDWMKENIENISSINIRDGVVQFRSISEQAQIEFDSDTEREAFRGLLENSIIKARGFPAAIDRNDSILHVISGENFSDTVTPKWISKISYGNSIEEKLQILAESNKETKKFFEKIHLNGVMACASHSRELGSGREFIQNSIASLVPIMTFAIENSDLSSEEEEKLLFEKIHQGWGNVIRSTTNIFDNFSPFKKVHPECALKNFSSYFGEKNKEDFSKIKLGSLKSSPYMYSFVGYMIAYMENYNLLNDFVFRSLEKFPYDPNLNNLAWQVGFRNRWDESILVERLRRIYEYTSHNLEIIEEALENADKGDESKSIAELEDAAILGNMLASNRYAYYAAVAIADEEYENVSQVAVIYKEDLEIISGKLRDVISRGRVNNPVFKIFQEFGLDEQFEPSLSNWVDTAAYISMILEYAKEKPDPEIFLKAKSEFERAMELAPRSADKSTQRRLINLHIRQAEELIKAYR